MIILGYRLGHPKIFPTILHLNTIFLFLIKVQMYTSLGSDRDKFREFKKRFCNARRRARHQARNAN